jgi:hypothetical protein
MGPLGKNDATLSVISERLCLEFRLWHPFDDEIRMSAEQITIARQIIHLCG